MIYLVWVAVFFCIAGALALLFDERMEYCLAPALCGGILLLYLFGLFGLLKPGIAAVALCGVVSAGYCLVRCVHGRTLFLRQWLTPAMLLALVGVAYIAWVQRGRLVMGNDEFSHWAVTVKMMTHLDALSITQPDRMHFLSATLGRIKPTLKTPPKRRNLTPLGFTASFVRNRASCGKQEVPSAPKG